MKNRAAILGAVSGLFLLVFVVAFLLRAGDDNSLFSWSWTFAKIEVTRVYVFLGAGLLVSALLSGRSLPAPYDVPFLAVFAFAAVLPLWAEPEIIIDASRYFTQAKHLETYGVGYFLKEWGGAIPAWTDLPLVPFLYGLIFRIFGENRLFIQCFTTCLFSLTVVLAYLAGKRLWDRETGFAGGLLLLGIPYLVTQVPLMLVDVPAMFFLTLSVFAFVEAIERGGIMRISCSVAAILCCILSKYSVWLMLSVLAVILTVYGFQNLAEKRRSGLGRGMLVLFTSALLSGTILLMKWHVVSDQIALLLDYQKPGLRRWEESFHSTFLFQIHPFITLLSLLSVAAAVRHKDAKYPIIGWLVLLVVLFSLKRIRYMLPVFPMLTLMAARGLQYFRQPELRRFFVYGTVASSLAVAFLAFLPFSKSMSSMNLRNAGAYLDAIGRDDFLVITLPAQSSPANPAVSVPLLDLFTRKKLHYCYEAPAFPGQGQRETSSLRFTWTYRNPPYYACPDANYNSPVIILTEVPAQPLPAGVVQRLAGYRMVKEFAQSERVFQYSVGVQIYDNGER